MFVHSLVRATHRNEYGWRAPIELGDAAPQYVSYVVPLNDSEELEKEYSCELVKTSGRNRAIQSHRLVKVGADTFLLELPQNVKLWFHVRAGGREGQRLPYVGTLKHDDFQYSFTELEPENLSEIDRLCGEQGLFIVGCDPEQHYSGVRLKHGVG